GPVVQRPEQCVTEDPDRPERAELAGALARPPDPPDRPALGIVHADGVLLGVGRVDPPVRADHESPEPGERELGVIHAPDAELCLEGEPRRIEPWRGRIPGRAAEERGDQRARQPGPGPPGTPEPCPACTPPPRPASRGAGTVVEHSANVTPARGPTASRTPPSMLPDPCGHGATSGRSPST